jgi:hypothetical protein
VLGESLDAIQVAGGIVAVLAIAAVAHQGADPSRRLAVSRPPGCSLWSIWRRRQRLSVPVKVGGDQLEPEAWPGRQGEQAFCESGFMGEDS